MILSIDASFGPACATLFDPDTGEIRQADSPVEIQHSQTIIPMIRTLLDQETLHPEHLHTIIYGHGPGSFTGIRILASVINGLNAGDFNIPVFGISSLQITACQVDADHPIHIIEDARSERVYIGSYRQGETIDKDQCIRMQDLPDAIRYPYAGFNLPDTLKSPVSLGKSRSAGLAMATQINLPLARESHTSYAQTLYLHQPQVSVCKSP